MDNNGNEVEFSVCNGRAFSYTPEGLARVCIVAASGWTDTAEDQHPG